VIDVDPYLDEAFESDIAEIIGTNPPNNCYIPSKSRKFGGRICCRTAARTSIVFDAILFVFGRPSASRIKSTFMLPMQKIMCEHLCDDHQLRTLKR
jgi:hypothetical protein